MSLKKLPVGIQTFKEIIEGNYVYVDKTKEAYNVISNYKYTFLSRPRRFGKSLFLDNLQNIFEGNKELFKGLYIYDKWDFENKYPVIKISWAGDLTSLEGVESRAIDMLRQNQNKLNVKCTNSNNPSSCLNELIINTAEKYSKPVVVLIDEYDKPILDVIEDPQQAKKHREFLRGFYSILKDNDQYIKFVFLTGVSKFSKASIFSGLNILEDISLLPEFGNVCGYTEIELKESFKDYLDGVDLNKVREWYNGYWFLKDKVYNPFDVLKYLKYKIFDNYWFVSGTPSFLIKLIQKNNYFLPKLSNLTVGKEIIDSFDVEKINLEVLMYQAGYLTIDKIIEDEEDESIRYRLYFPNKEVKKSFNDYIIYYFLQDEDPASKRKPIRKALKNEDLEGFKEALKSLFASISYHNYTNNEIYKYEGFYVSIIYAYLQSLGIDIIGEDVTNRGRIDLTLFIEDKIYIIEFKVLKDENEKGSALKQIKEKKYYKKYLTEGKKIYLVGIEFCEDKKNVCNFEWEEV